MANFKFEPIFVGAGFELGNDKNVTEPTQQSQDKLESLSFSITSIGELTSSFKTDAGKLLGSLADRSPNSTFDELSQLYRGRSFDLRDPLFVETPKLAELVKERCVPEGNSPAIPFKDVLAPPSDSQSVASSNPDFKILSDSSQGMSDSYSLSLDNDRIVKYSYQQTTTLEFNEKNIIITHANGNILTLSATKNPYQGSVSYTVGNDDAKNLGEAWNHDLKDIVVMFLTTGKLETENHDDGNVWRIPSEAETEKSESINFLKDVAEGVKAKVAAEVEASEAEEGDAKLQGPTKGEVISKAIESWEHWQSNSMVKEKSWAYQPEGSHYLLVWESNKIFLEHESDDARQNDEWEKCEVDRVKSTIEDWITRKWDKFYPADKVSESSDKTSSTGSDLAADAGREAGHSSFVPEVSSSRGTETLIQVVDWSENLPAASKSSGTNLTTDTAGTPQPSTVSQSSDTTTSSSASEATSVTYERGTPIKDVRLKHSEAKKAEYPSSEQYDSINSVESIIQKVKEAGGQALVSIRLQKDAIRGHAHNGFRTKIINLLETSPVTDAQANMTWPSWSAPPQAPKVSQNDSFAILREGQDGKFYVTMRFTFAEADGQNDGYKQKVDRDARPTQPSLILPFNKKEDALSCIAYLSEDMTNIPALIEELIPDLKNIDYRNLVKPSDDYNKNLHFFEDATN